MTNYKLLAIIPASLAIISIIYLIYILTGPGLNLDIDLKGGTQVSFESENYINPNTIKAALPEFDANVRSAKGLSKWTTIIEVDSETNTNELMKKLKDNGFDLTDFSIQTVGPALSASFFQQAQIAILLALLFLAGVVFFIFKDPLPSAYMFSCTLFDIIETLALSQMLGIKLSLATFAALLLIIGYSVDDNILLTSRILKRGEGKVEDIIKSARKTGLTMVFTSLSAVVVLFLMSGATVISQITGVLIIGLLCDMTNTWIVNVGLLKWHVKVKNINNGTI